MNLEDLLDAHQAGQKPDVPPELRSEFDRAVAGLEALQAALSDPATGPYAAVDRPPPALPDDYEIVRELGRGGMGVVYLVRQKSLGRQVAVKVLRPGEATFCRVVQRFLEEARHLARLRHANIVSIHEIGRAGDEPYFTMDYVEGEPLAALLARERPTPTRALALLEQVAEGVAHAHQQGIIHRDLKPGNILVDPLGRAYVTDFGLSRDLTRDSALTHPGEIVGTPAYMAPEQAGGQTALVGETTDVHALGAILFEMLTGRPPYGGGAPIDVLIRVLMDEPLPPRRIDRRIPRDLETICLKCLAKAPERRYPTVRALIEDVHRFETGQPILARRPGLIARGLRFVRRRWKMAAALAVTAATAALVAVLLLGPGADERIAAGDERHEAGKHAEAVQLYRRALRRSGDFPRSIALERIVRCCQEAGDEAGAVEAALQTLDYDPDAWFGEYNHAVAEAIRARPRTIRTKPSFGITRDVPADELLLKRLQIYLNGPHGSDAERARAEQALAELRLRLGNVPPGFSGVPQRPLTFPTGKPADLLRQADDRRAGPLQRAAAAVGAGKVLEQAGDTPAARQAYRKAYEVLRAHFPVYAGVTQNLEMSHPRSLRLESQECSALRFVAHSLRRLDPTMKNPLRGGLRLRITGLDLPPDLVVQLSLTLWDPRTADTGRGMQVVDGERIPAPLGNVVVQLDQTAWVGVADGRYRLAVQGTSRGSRSSASYGARANRLFGRMKLDFSALGAKPLVEVRGQTLDLPPIRAWLRE